MFLNQLFRLIAGVVEIGFALVLFALFVIGISFISRGYTAFGVSITVGVVWFAASALKNRE